MPSFVPVLYGIADLDLPETLVIGMTIALAQSYCGLAEGATPVRCAKATSPTCLS